MTKIEGENLMKKMIIPMVIIFSLISVATVSAQRRWPSIREAKACLGIGNIEGKGPVTCEGEGGHSYGKSGVTFHTGDKIFILIRFRDLKLGEHTLRTRYYRHDGHGWKLNPSYSKTYKFTNKVKSWAYWFEATAKEDGRWKVDFALDKYGFGSFGPTRMVEYCVNCPLE